MNKSFKNTLLMVLFLFLPLESFSTPLDNPNEDNDIVQSEKNKEVKYLFELQMGAAMRMINENQQNQQIPYYFPYLRFGFSSTSLSKWQWVLEGSKYERKNSEDQISVKLEVLDVNFLVDYCFYQSDENSFFYLESGVSASQTEVTTKVFNYSFKEKTRLDPSLVLGGRFSYKVENGIGIDVGVRAYLSEKLDDSFDLGGFLGLSKEF